MCVLRSLEYILSGFFLSINAYQCKPLNKEKSVETNSKETSSFNYIFNFGQPYGAGKRPYRRSRWWWRSRLRWRQWRFHNICMPIWAWSFLHSNCTKCRRSRSLLCDLPQFTRDCVLDPLIANNYHYVYFLIKNIFSLRGDF
jgi:hypothetical protein